MEYLDIDFYRPFKTFLQPNLIQRITTDKVKTNTVTTFAKMQYHLKHFCSLLNANNYNKIVK